MTIFACLMSLGSIANALTGELILPPGVDADTVSIESIDHGFIMHPNADGSFIIDQMNGGTVIVYSDGHNFPTQVFLLEGEHNVIDPVAATPIMAPGTSRTMNLNGQTTPGAEVYVIGTQAKAVADSAGNFKIYPTISREASQIRLLIKSEGMSVQSSNVDISGIPLHQSADIGMLELVGDASPVTELNPLPKKTIAEKPIVSIPAGPISDPAMATPVTPWYSPIVWPLATFIGIICILAVFRSQQKRIAELIFQLRLRTGTYDKTLSKEYRRRNKLLNELKRMHAKLVTQIEKAQEIIPGVKHDTTEADSQWKGLREDIRVLKKHLDNLESKIKNTQRAQERLKLSLRIGHALDIGAFSADEEIGSQIREATASLHRSDERLEQLRRAQQEIARLTR